MFDVGFWELIMIGVVALVVVGPERLPRMARVAGLWLGRARRVLGSVKAEIDRELKADELREILRKQAESNPLQRIIEETGASVSRPFTGSATGGTDATPGSIKPPASPSSSQSGTQAVAQPGSPSTQPATPVTGAAVAGPSNPDQRA
jgi:sec-independent protein translocase protein TatB